jgi:hypothetical protein
MLFSFISIFCVTFMCKLCLWVFVILFHSFFVSSQIAVDVVCSDRSLNKIMVNACETKAVNSLKQPQLVKTFQKTSEPLGRIGLAGLGKRLHLSLVAFVTLTSEIHSTYYVEGWGVTKASVFVILTFIIIFISVTFLPGCAQCDTRPGEDKWDRVFSQNHLCNWST